MGNVAKEAGGAIFINKGSIHLFYNSRFENNTAEDGGALKVNVANKIVIEDSDFESGKAAKGAGITFF